MTELILFEQHDNGVAVLIFNRPQALNALNLAAMRSFQDHIVALSQQQSLRVLILTGAGERAFCSGGDLVELSQRPTQQDALDFITLMGDALLAMEQLQVPVVAAINGYALGGGSEIALACDLRIIDASAKMGMVQINMGLTPGWGAGQRLLRVLGYSRAMDLLLRGTVLHADEIVAYGLANQMTAEGEALAGALAFAGEIAAQPQEVVAGIKTLLRAGLHQPYEAALQTERAIFPPLWAGEAHLRAVEAFLQRQTKKATRNVTES